MAFCNACHNIEANDKDTYMCLFVNSLEGKATTDFFNLPPKILSTWEELVYWFKSTYGQSKSLNKQLRGYKIFLTKVVRLLSPLTFASPMKLYNQIHELILPQNQVAFMHYYNEFPSPYIQRIEEKAIDNIGSTLHTFLEYREKLEITGLPKGDSVKKTYMSALLQLVQDMNNQMMAYERKGNVPSLTHGASSSSSTPFRNTNKKFF